MTPIQIRETVKVPDVDVFDDDALAQLPYEARIAALLDYEIALADQQGRYSFGGPDYQKEA
jgi:hypothetical protein